MGLKSHFLFQVSSSFNRACRWCAHKQVGLINVIEKILQRYSIFLTHFVQISSVEQVASFKKFWNYVKFKFLLQHLDSAWKLLCYKYTNKHSIGSVVVAITLRIFRKHLSYFHFSTPNVQPVCQNINLGKGVITIYVGGAEMEKIEDIFF